MRGSRAIEFVLEILQGGAEASAAIFDVMTSGYAESRRKAFRLAKYPRSYFKTNWAETFRDRQNFYRLLNYLKSQGLVESKKGGRGPIWKITKQGGEKLDLLRARNFYAKEAADYGEKTGHDTSVKIIVYDIPQGEERKRRWLRWALKNLGFTLLQKSVWTGKRKIPEEFLFDLKTRHMLPYVHIFEIAKSGTLREMT